MDNVSSRDDRCDEEDGTMVARCILKEDAVVVYIRFLRVSVVIKRKVCMSIENVDVISYS